jgi:DNA uptake protein ComE-like DNA-binding protein
MWKAFSDFFYLSPRDRKGVAVFFIVIFFLLVFRVIQYRSDWQAGVLWRKEVIQKISHLNTSNITDELNEVHSKVNKHPSTSGDILAFESNVQWKDFNPNFVDRVQLHSFGLPGFLTERWLNYLEKGGAFRRPEDVLKLYSMDSLWWLEAKRYMYFDDKDISVRKDRLYFEFDPHRIDSTDASKLGFSPWQYRQLRKYVESGKVIEAPDDLLQVYGIDPALYQQVKPYIRLDESPYPIDLNTADSLDLLRLQQVGPYFVEQILALRRMVGGFIDCKQLMTIRSMDTLRCNAICSQVFIEQNTVKRYDINKAQVSELAGIPFLSQAAAREIVSFRENFRPFISVDEVVNLSLFPQKYTFVILPYLLIDSDE